MWQSIVVYAIVAIAASLTVWKFYSKFTGKSSCCGGGCSCSSSGNSTCCSTDNRPGGNRPSGNGPGSGGPRGSTLKPLSGCGCQR